MVRHALALAAAVVLSSSTLSSQVGQRTVRGSVRDTAGQPVDQVQVLAMTEGRKTTTGSDGRFQLDSFPLGEERFLFRRLGFNPVEVTVVVNTEDREIDVRMTPRAQELKPVVVRGRRSGVLGTVRDANDRPITGAEITVLGGASATQTDSLGRFSLPTVPAGTFMLMVRKRGYFALRHAVILPVGEALDVPLVLAQVPSGLNERRISRLAGFGGLLDAAWDAHASRRVRCSGGNSVFVPREELAEQQSMRLDFALPRAPSALSRGFGGEELRRYAVFIDGQNGMGWPLSAIPADQVEAVEVYRGASTSGVPRRIVPWSLNPTSSFNLAPGICPSGTIWIWMR
jgi:Carboxypeptidase regulatory-like domain/CarboxypepD_reg-like domain